VGCTDRPTPRRSSKYPSDTLISPVWATWRVFGDLWGPSVKVSASFHDSAGVRLEPSGDAPPVGADRQGGVGEVRPLRRDDRGGGRFRPRPHGRQGRLPGREPRQVQQGFEHASGAAGVAAMVRLSSPSSSRPWASLTVAEPSPDVNPIRLESGLRSSASPLTKPLGTPFGRVSAVRRPGRAAAPSGRRPSVTGPRPRVSTDG
jgi:hypothetical protein